jgi:aminotransferase
MRSTAHPEHHQRISKRAKSIKESRISQSLSVIERDPSIISLGAGEPDFMTPPNVRVVAQSLMDAGTHYSPLQGIRELRESIASKVKRENQLDVTAENVIVTSGSNEAILLTMLSILDPGDEVIMPDPGYPSYRPIAMTVGAIPISQQIKECERFIAQAESLRRLVTSRTKMLVINSPSNPMGTILHRGILEEIADIVVEKDLTVLTDEAYEKYVYDDAEHVSFASLNGMGEYSITIQTFSKSYAMNGYRVGYAVGPVEVIKEMAKMKICTTLSSPTVSQWAALEAFKANEYVLRMREEYDRRRKMMMKRLSELRTIHFVRPQGAFYIFPHVGIESEDFANLLLREAKVLVVPGSEFGNYGSGYVRMSYANAYDKIEEAMNRIEKVIGRV